MEVINIGRKKNLLRQKFGHLTVLKEVYSEKYGVAWLCECDCKDKTQLVLDSGRLTSGRKQHCGCLKVRRNWKEVKYPHEYIGKIKICKQCGKEKLYTNYYFKEYLDSNSNIIYQFDAICIDCSKENAKQRILNNREQHLESLRKNNKRENIKENKKKDVDRRRQAGYFTDYIKRDYVKENYKNKYNPKHRDHDITNNEWIACKDFFKNGNKECCCAYCNITEEEAKFKYGSGLHKDHTDCEGHNDIRNCTPSCKMCNDRKWQLDMEAWFREQSFFTEEKLAKIKQWNNEEYKKYIEDKPPYKIKRKRIENENGSYYLIHELWSVDEKRNLIKCIASGRYKKDLQKDIEDFLNNIESK